jgi:hypothetical protein
MRGTLHAFGLAENPPHPDFSRSLSSGGASRRPVGVKSDLFPQAGRGKALQCLWNTSVRSSMLSRGGASGGVVGSMKAVCGPNLVRPSVAES